MIQVFTVGPFQENCYVVARDGDLLIVDPGDEADRLMEAIDATGLRPRYLLLTHGHLDHVGAVSALQARYDCPVLAPADELPLIEQLPLQCQLFGLPPMTPPRVDRTIADGESLAFGQGTIEAIATPGHSPGGTCFRVGDHVFVGDTIFQGGVGRTDLWGGSWPTLERSIRERIFTLPEHLALYPGHGPATTVGDEKRSNPFFQ